MNTIPPPRGPRRKENRPAQLIEAALLLFTQKGYAATRAEEIAKAAGVSKGTLFLYFNSKEELFEAVVRQSITPVIQDALNLSQQHSGSASDLLRHLIDLWWQRSGDTTARSVPNLIVNEGHHFPECTQYYNKAVLEPSRHIVLSVVQRGIKSGEFRPDLDPQQVWLAFHSLLTYPSTWDKARAHMPENPALLAGDMGAFVRFQCDLLLRGLAPTPSPSQK